nr:2OG-Fe(II) oxygenase [uncultured Moraxella sp.]
MFQIDWQQKISENDLNNFDNLGFFVIDNCFEKNDFYQLQQESGLIAYQQAHLTHGERLTAIRGDSTRWIENTHDCPVGMQYLASIENLGRFFNYVFFAGIKRCEAHYARYPVGFGYQWHSDNPVGRDERVISAVFYLNENWGENNGGEILLIDKQKIEQKLQPQGNRLVVFDSNLRHQVEITHRERFSIATWFRRDEIVF